MTATHPSLNIAAERAEFEQHLCAPVAGGAGALLDLSRNGDGYRDLVVNAKWDGWLGARSCSAEQAPDCGRCDGMGVTRSDEEDPSTEEQCDRCFGAGKEPAARAGAGVLQALMQVRPHYDDAPQLKTAFLSGHHQALTQAALLVREHSGRPHPPEIYMDELDAANAGQAWLNPLIQFGTKMCYSDDKGPVAARVKWAAIFDRYDRVVGAYLLTRDLKNFTQLCVFEGRAFAPAMEGSPGTLAGQ